jgi:hypothetical protein
MQDFLGEKIFPSILELMGMNSLKMSEILSIVEKENIIDSYRNCIIITIIVSNEFSLWELFILILL